MAAWGRLSGPCGRDAAGSRVVRIANREKAAIREIPNRQNLPNRKKGHQQCSKNQWWYDYNYDKESEPIINDSKIAVGQHKLCIVDPFAAEMGSNPALSTICFWTREG